MYTVYASETNVHGCVIKPVFSGPPKPLMFSTVSVRIRSAPESDLRVSVRIRSAPESDLRAVVASIEGFGGHENA